MYENGLWFCKRFHSWSVKFVSFQIQPIAIWSIWDFKCLKKKTTQQAAGGADPARRLYLPQVWSRRNEQMRHFGTPRLTCADSDSANKLLSPAAAPHHQGQVRLLDQLVHCALQAPTKGKKAEERCVHRYETHSISIISTLLGTRDADDRIRCNQQHLSSCCGAQWVTRTDAEKHKTPLSLRKRAICQHKAALHQCSK